MDRSPFFIYSRKEMMVLVTLGITILSFAFTLGIHMGKRIGGTASVADGDEITPLAERAEDEIPDATEFTEQMKNAIPAAEDALTRTLHDEVGRTGVKLNQRLAVKLPKKAASKEAGETTLRDETEVAVKKTLPMGKWTLQIGSYPDLNEAKQVSRTLEKRSLEAFVYPIDIKGKGRWFRVYVGGFASRGKASSAGSQYRKKQVIKDFLVVKTPRG
jgi:cell division protein FtsN